MAMPATTWAAARNDCTPTLLGLPGRHALPSIASKKISAEAAAALVKSGDWVDYGFGIGQPDLFDRGARRARSDELRGVKIRACLTLRPRAVLEADPDGRALPLVQLALLRLRPRAARRRPLQLHPDELRRGARLLPPLHRSDRRRLHQDLPDGRRTATSTSAAPSPTTRR